MKGYYCETMNDREILFIPFVLFGRESGKIGNGMVYNYNRNTLENLTLALKERRITKEDLERRELEIIEIDIPDIYIRAFRELCFKRAGRKKIDKIAGEIYSYVSESVEEMRKTEEALYEKDEDYEDSDDEWWEGGEEAPWE